MTNFLRTFLYLIFLFVLFAACSNKSLTTGGGEKYEAIPNYLSKSSDYIFDDSKLHTFELVLEDSLLALIDSDPAAEKYVEGNLNFEGETIYKVGIRYKGSIGSFVYCLSGTDDVGDNFFDPSGYKTCTKLSMKIKINRVDSNATFYGLKKLQFHAQNLDKGKLRERLGYYMYRSIGIEAPRSVHARLLINGKYSGIYGLTEQIDGQFVQENFSDGTGNLYKEIWPNDQNGNPYNKKGLIDALETNEKEADVSRMIAFGEAIAAASESELADVVEQWMDMDRMINYIAVDRAIRADDGALHWYCFNGECSNHNLYWYENPANGKMYLIPWDMDNSFENIIEDNNPVSPIADDWGTSRADCNPYPYGAMGLLQRSAICDKLTRAWSLYDTEYDLAKRKLYEGPMSKENIDQLINIWSDQIRSATQEAEQLHGDATSLSDWESAVQLLKDQMDFARNKMIEDAK